MVIDKTTVHLDEMEVQVSYFPCMPGVTQEDAESETPDSAMEHAVSHNNVFIHSGVNCEDCQTYHSVNAMKSEPGPP